VVTATDDALRTAISENARLKEALAPLARLAHEYDDRVFPDSPGSQTISVPLGLLRAAREALTA
jgi:hypothetical protein